MLDLRPNCECCDRDLPPDAADAMICTFECTFCAACADHILAGVCPNCGGNLVARPVRPAAMLAKHPASTRRVLKGKAANPEHPAPRDRRRFTDATSRRGTSMLRKVTTTAAFLALGTLPAFAHLDPGEHGSFMAGFTHPLFGLDHILAMVAVGLWAVMIGGRAIWLVPAAFVGTMLAGFLAAMAGLPLPFVEPTILASVVVMGFLVALAAPVPVGAGMAVVGFFALFHGHAHGGEMGEAGMLGYAAGFAIATALLHAAGLALGLLNGRAFTGEAGRTATRAAGALTALGGLWLAIAG